MSTTTSKIPDRLKAAYDHVDAGRGHLGRGRLAMYTIGIDGPGCSCDSEGCSLCAAIELSCEACGAVLTDANRGDGIGDLCATCLATGGLDLVAELADAEVA